MPTHLEDSDGNNADDDSIDSFMQRQNNFGYRESDDVPTRDVGPERLPNLFSQVKKNHLVGRRFESWWRRTFFIFSSVFEL